MANLRGKGPCSTSQHRMLRARLDTSSAQTIQMYGWLRWPFRLFHICLVCLMAVHVVKKPNPSVKPQVIDMMDRSVSSVTLLPLSKRSLTTRKDAMEGKIQILEARRREGVYGRPAMIVNRTMWKGHSKVMK